MERKKYQITKQSYKVFSNNDKSQIVSNINIKRYRQAKLLIQQDRRITKEVIQKQYVKNYIPQGLSIINMGIHNLTQQ